MLPIFIMAAGMSQRMQPLGDKLSLELKGVPLLRRSILVAQQVSQDVRVVLPYAKHPRCAQLEGTLARPLYTNLDNEFAGLSKSLKLVAQQGISKQKAIMVTLADLILLTADDLKAVYAAHHPASGALITRGGTKDGQAGHPVIFEPSVTRKLSDLSGDQGAKSLLKLYNQHTKIIPLNEQHALFDIDTPEDWQGVLTNLNPS